MSARVDRAQTDLPKTREDRAMSTAPSGTGTAPPGHIPAGARWRIKHSLWLVVPIFGLGCLGGAGFLYVGIRARRPGWWIAGLVYLAVVSASFPLIDDPDENTVTGNAAVGAILVAWAASIVHALLINPSWLRWQAGRTRPAEVQNGSAMWPGALAPAGPVPHAYYPPPARTRRPSPAGSSLPRSCSWSAWPRSG
jgi:hypothetical protein